MKIDYEFYETKPKIHWFRILYITLIILMIIWGGILGIYHFNTKKIENRQQNEKIGIHNTQRKYDINGIMELAKKEGLPVLSEQAKNDIKNIYKSDTKRIFLTFDLLNRVRAGEVTTEQAQKESGILAPVSYTHLDVYKRQPLERVAGAGVRARAAIAPARSQKKSKREAEREKLAIAFYSCLLYTSRCV